MAPLDGEIKIQNLSSAVKITRDNYGIPHIKAANKLDALRALGFVIASERLFQMELSRRLTQGELSEVFGEVALKSDKLYRSLMLKRSVQRMLEHEKKNNTFDQTLWQELEAYFDGVNQYVQTRTLPYEMTLLGIKPRRFEPIDAYIMTGHMAYSFGVALKADPLMTKLASQLPAEVFQNLRNDPLKAPLKIVDNKNFKTFEDEANGNFIASFEGSNAWLISPSRSQSGSSLFANDPHIGYSFPSVWIEAHIQTPEFELYGHHLALVPFAILGHSRHHAWGFTMSLADDMDLYREVLDRHQQTVLFNNKDEVYKTWTETIKVKDSTDVVLEMIETSHGPLMDHFLEEKNLALKWAFHRPENNPMKALRLMGEAKDLGQFESALQFGTAPGLNVMYADRVNIAWWMFGDIAVKKNPNSDMILDGSTGQDEYVRILPWKEKPHSINPESGFIVTANSRPPGLSADIRGDWQSDDRLQTITKALQEKDQWSAEEFKALQTENFNAQTKLLLDKLFENLKLSEAEYGEYTPQIQELKNWNFLSNTDSKAAALYHQWNNEIIQLMMKDIPEDQRKIYLNTPYAWISYQRLIENLQAPFWNNKHPDEIITQGFINAAEKLGTEIVWGDIHTVEYVHPLGRKAPLSYLFNLGPYPMPGSYNDINNNKMHALGADFKVVAGPSTRRIIDFASPQKSWGINPIGISGHMLSPFYKDQVQMFIEGKYREQLLDQADIEKAKTHELTLY
ncbi:penicillin acylase family protein [Bdellovibrio reynosensis]|uniref:Penicillin acylase family protein n=1 Tax=Bdellovibrio reynosensis TaxID=2835041 RepID=A0ABY4C9V7_9BACT|nr:penicillin acylase family protein [Bdellovibrio reynosensis]UOF01748.1 penicillin acylase family protein [Bdellovibrio reynosensis]